MHVEGISVSNGWLFIVLTFQGDSVEGPASFSCDVIIYKLSLQY